MRINWKKTIIILLDLMLGVYLTFAITKFNKPDESKKVCTKVNINIQDEMTNGFLNAKEIKKRLEAKQLYPLKKKMTDISARKIEETLKTFCQDSRMLQDTKRPCRHPSDTANAYRADKERQQRGLLY